MKSAKKYMALILTAFIALIAIAFVSSAALTASAETDNQPVAVIYATEDDTTVAAEPAEENGDDGVTGKALAAGIAIGLAALGGAIGMGIAIAKASEGISRQPEAEKGIRSSTMLGLFFLETAIIYAFVIAIIIVFVL